MNFTIYNLTSGEIICSGQAPDINVQIIPSGCNLIASYSNPEKDYVIDGVVTPFPPKPGEFYVFDYGTKQWVPDQTAADTAARAQRNGLLAASDWTQMPDVEISTKTQWAAYRQALRDVTDQPGYPFNIIWPTPPQ
jgi:hypothetical protein